jgi:LacI family gluconate utilization system Gnt-I transcriptional repressor
VPGRIGLAGFNGVELLEGLPQQLATMDACRREIGIKAAQIIAQLNAGGDVPGGPSITLDPKLAVGDTLRR